MKHRILAIVGGLSLLIAVAASIAWYSSDPYPMHSLSYSTLDASGHEYFTMSARVHFGQLKVWWQQQHFLYRQDAQSLGVFYHEGWYLVGIDFSFTPHPSPSLAARAERAGFAWYSQENDFGEMWQEVRGIVLPLWLIVAVSGGMGVAALRAVGRSIRVERRKARGQCVRCGYDLRESPQRCPECGREVGV